jgi:preprotein translocase subunit Sec61beta
MSKRAKTKSTKASRSRERKKAELAPIAGAGLIRFFKEETEGVSLPPYVVIVIAVALIALVLALPALLPI